MHGVGAEQAVEVARTDALRVAPGERGPEPVLGVLRHQEARDRPVRVLKRSLHRVHAIEAQRAVRLRRAWRPRLMALAKSWFGRSRTARCGLWFHGLLG